MSGAHPQPGTVKRGEDMRVGDVLGSRMGQGGDRTVTRIIPYPNPHLFDFMDERWTILKSGTWGQTCDPDHPWRLTVDGTWANAFHVNTDGTWIE